MRKAFAKVLTFVLVLTFVFGASSVFAASTDPNPNVTIVNPVNDSTSYSTSLLVSVKLTAPSTIKINVYQKQKPSTSDNSSTPVAITAADWDKYIKDKAAGKEVIPFSNKAIIEEEKFTSDNKLSFYTKKIEKVSPGVYQVNVNTLDAEGNTRYTDRSVVVITEKETTAADSKNDQGASQFLQNLLKGIFGN